MHAVGLVSQYSLDGDTFDFYLVKHPHVQAPPKSFTPISKTLAALPSGQDGFIAPSGYFNDQFAIVIFPSLSEFVYTESVLPLMLSHLKMQGPVPVGAQLSTSGYLHLFPRNSGQYLFCHLVAFVCYRDFRSSWRPCP